MCDDLDCGASCASSTQICRHFSGRTRRVVSLLMRRAICLQRENESALTSKSSVIFEPSLRKRDTYWTHHVQPRRPLLNRLASAFRSSPSFSPLARPQIERSGADTSLLESAQLQQRARQRRRSRARHFAPNRADKFAGRRGKTCASRQDTTRRPSKWACSLGREARARERAGELANS